MNSSYLCKAGTWTPFVIGGSIEGTLNYGTQFGYYFKMGSLCYIQARIIINTFTDHPKGNIYLCGLPYKAYSVSSSIYSLSTALCLGGQNDCFERLSSAYLRSNETRITFCVGSQSNIGHFSYARFDSNSNDYNLMLSNDVPATINVSGWYRITGNLLT